jgi:ATP-dependent exoDNAse (exonuclease V) beta subunit
MPSAPRNTPPPDQAERDAALDPHRSILVRAPAGSGKTTLLSQRFLRLLAEVDDPGQVVAITFTNAAAAEMRNRILDELRKDEPGAAAACALKRSKDRGWDLLNLPGQLRIQTIDSFCRDLALQQPLLSGLGGSLDISEQPAELYRRAARRTLQQIGQTDHALSIAIETLLEWRDNNWREIEDLTVDMLKNRDRWMQDFVLGGEQNLDDLRPRLELPFQRTTDSGCTGYSDEEWHIVRSCFSLLRHAAAELRVVFAEAGAADFTEVAQIALGVLKGEEGIATEAAAAVADGIRHLLVDEFQDTSRRQHELLRHLIAAWTGRDDRTCFVVGDPMQSIYFFRNADAELFPRVEKLGFDIPDDQPFLFDSVHLAANFRSDPSLVSKFNETFEQVFAKDDGSGIGYEMALPARVGAGQTGPRLVAEAPRLMQLHLEFVPDTLRSGSNPDTKSEIAVQKQSAQQKQVSEIVAIIQNHLPRIAQARAANEKYRVAVIARARKSLTPIAVALREAGIPFRAVDLEDLKDRPEIIDACALARALLNPEDRVAWLGVLRAPWCGLSLSDLHALSSTDDKILLTRPVPELLRERTSLLSEEGQISATRLQQAIEFAGRSRATQPAASLGTWLEQVWLHLGGAHCVDAEARANLDLLWKCFDHLPEGEADLLGPALCTALNDLKAQPDPAVSSDCGVHLMTIHKSKGLEFEIVIIPDLQAGAGRNHTGMLSWLERGLPPESAVPGSNNEITEFLVAPFSSKGSESGRAKRWVDRQRHDRELQEARRLFYVACTRAREKLHLFARPSFKIENGAPSELAQPRESLLATAWPALETVVRKKFEAWRADQAATAEPATLESIAASSAGKVSDLPLPGRPTRMRRLPSHFRILNLEPSLASTEAPLLGAVRLYERHEGGLLSRALGKAVHALLQRLAQQLITQSWDKACAALQTLAPQVAAGIRAAGVDPSQASRLAAQALQISLHTAADPMGKWILSPQLDAASEVRWSGVINGRLRTVQVDRIFRAGHTPQSSADTPEKAAWWIIDYKTAHEDGLDAASALPELRKTFASQIEAYAKVLRNLHGTDATVFGGIYYPRMSLFDWWQL